MSRYCLDTVAYSYFKRGDSRIAALLDEADWIGIPVIVLGELFAGFEHGVHRERNIRELEAFLSFPMVEVLQVTGRPRKCLAGSWPIFAAEDVPCP